MVNVTEEKAKTMSMRDLAEKAFCVVSELEFLIDETDVKHSQMAQNARICLYELLFFKIRGCERES